MPFDADPYRALGLAPGASLNEIRSAYRRLAKKYHPDAAGDRALPRFLSIQAAYERLVDDEGRLRRPGGGGAAGAGGRAPGERPAGPAPWRADASRARASREAWRARRSGGASQGGPAAAGRPGGRPGGRRGGGDQGRRPSRRATPGSTSYDEAAETPLDPEWDGGAWYGPSSGTYWTLNPREYADPRKHGPEYLARARRAFGPDAGPDAGTDGGEGGSAATPGARPPGWAKIESIVRRLRQRGLLAIARRPGRR